MPRARCTESYDAERRYKAGEKLVDIARSLQVPEGTVRRWKSTQDWDGKKAGTAKKKQSERSENKANARNQGTRTQPIPPSVDQALAAAVEENEDLTPQQRDFCVYYSRIKNATQSYLKAYGCSYNTAMTEGCRLLRNPKIKSELRQLQEIKIAMIDELCGADVVELHMRIAFADITDFVEFKGKTVPVTYKGEVVTIEHPKTGERVPVTETVNTVRLRDSNQVDGQILTEVSEGREGVKVKLADRQKSLDFLARYFSLNPMDQHKKEYDGMKMELELLRLEAAQQMQADEPEASNSNFLDAMMGSVSDIWDEDNDPDDPLDGEGVGG